MAATHSHISFLRTGHGGVLASLYTFKSQFHYVLNKLNNIFMKRANRLVNRKLGRLSVWVHLWMFQRCVQKLRKYTTFY